MSQTKILDPVCDMVVDVAEQREAGLALELSDREYAFCGQGCLAKFAKTPEAYRAKVDAWLAAGEHDTAHAHVDELPMIDNGMREWYKSCRCCMHDAYPKVVEQLDAERDAMKQPVAEAGICETAEAATPQKT
jgi:YHS domain-containing protein